MNYLNRKCAFSNPFFLIEDIQSLILRCGFKKPMTSAYARCFLFSRMLINILLKLLRAVKNFIDRPNVVIVSIIKSINYMNQDLNNAMKFKKRRDLFRYSINKADVIGMFLEFGVFNGETINFMSEAVPDKLIFGFIADPASIGKNQSFN